MRYSGSRFDRGGFSVPGGRLALSFFFLLLVAILLLFVHRADPTLFEHWRTRVVDFSKPVIETVSWPVKAVRNLITDLGEFWDVYEENEQLRKQVEELKVWQSAALHYESQVAHYEKLMKVQPLPGIEYVTARLITDGGSPFKHTYILNAGEAQGISNGQGVVQGLDLIGRIVNVGHNSSRVLSVTDINSRIPVMVEPSRQRAIMAGDNSSRPKLEFVESELDIRAGNRVVTSGDGGLLPPGLPIGVVVQQEAGKFRVRPRTNNQRFETVRVVRYTFTIDVDDTDGSEGDLPLGNAPKPGEPGADSTGSEQGAPVAGSEPQTPPSRNSGTGPEAAPRREETSPAAAARAAENHTTEDSTPSAPDPLPSGESEAPPAPPQNEAPPADSGRPGAAGGAPADGD